MAYDNQNPTVPMLISSGQTLTKDPVKPVRTVSESSIDSLPPGTKSTIVVSYF